MIRHLFWAILAIGLIALMFIAGGRVVGEMLLAILEIIAEIM